MSLHRMQQILEKMPSIDPILVIGDVGIDKYTLGEVSRISPEAPVPVVEVTKEWTKLGLASNISHNLQTVNVRSTICGVIGNDTNGDLFERLLEESKLSTWGLVRDSSRPTTFKERVTTPIQQVCRIDYEKTTPIEAELELKLMERIREFSSGHGAIILEDYAKGTLTSKLVAEIIQDGHKKGKKIFVDPYRTKPADTYRNCDLFKPNLAEGKMLAKSLGMHDGHWSDITQLFIDRLNIAMVAMTLGPEGMIIQEKGKAPVHVPTAATEVFDVSGAGDTTISLLTASMAAGATLEEAAIIGNCAAGVVVGKKGTATVDQQELIEFFTNKFNPAK